MLEDHEVMVAATCQDLIWTLDNFMMWLVLKTRWKIIGGTKLSSNLTTTYGVPPLSHNVATKWNTAVSWIPKMTIVLAKNSDALHTVLATPNKPVGALDLGIRLSGLLDTPMGLEMVYINTNDYGSHT